MVFYQMMTHCFLTLSISLASTQNVDGVNAAPNTAGLANNMCYVHINLLRLMDGLIVQLQFQMEWLVHNRFL